MRNRAPSSRAGELPPELGQLTNLTKLQLNGNRFSGELPIEILRMKAKVRKVLLCNNYPGFTLPRSIGPLGDDIAELDLFDCSVRGGLPSELGDMVAAGGGIYVHRSRIKPASEEGRPHESPN